MFSPSPFLHHCCLISQSNYNSIRIVSLLERRLKRNSWYVSFDFKSLSPEKPSKKSKVSRSLLRIQPKVLQNDDALLDSSSSSSSDEEPIEETSNANDDYLARLAEWIPDQRPVEEPEDEDEEGEEPQTDLSSNSDPIVPSTRVESESTESEEIELVYSSVQVKNEPSCPSLCIPQLDGQTDFQIHYPSKSRKCSNFIDLTRSSRTKKMKTPLIHSLIPPSPPRRRPKEKLVSLKRPRDDSSTSIDRKRKKTLISLPNGKRRRQPTNDSRRTLLDYFPADRIEEKTKIPRRERKKSENYFDNCIVIDDSDEEIKEVERTKCYSICDGNLRSHERLLSETINSSVMRMKWLKKLEFILAEQILHNDDRMSISETFLRMILENFLRMFVVHHSDHEDEELAFYQSSWTCYLRSLLIDSNVFQSENEFSSILDPLFDLLFDLIDLDVVERDLHRFRSNLIENDDFSRKFSSKHSSKKNFFRVKLLLYFIELILFVQHRSNPSTSFSYHRNTDHLFQWIEDALQHCIHQAFNSIDERMSICFNVMELCLLIVEDKADRVKQMATLLMKLLEKHPEFLQFFLSDEHLFVDVRLLLVHQIISKRFDLKLNSIDQIHQLFDRVQLEDETSLLIIRSLFNSYADLMIETQPIFLMNTIQSAQVTMALRDQLDLFCSKFSELNENAPSLPSIQRMSIFFRLLKYKWKHF